MSTQEAPDHIEMPKIEWTDAYYGYMESLDAEFEQYESSIHQDGFAAGWTLGQEAALATTQAELAAMRERAEALDKALLGLMLDVQLGNDDDIKRGLDQARQVRKETCPPLAAAPPAPAADSRADAAPAEGA